MFCDCYCCRLVNIVPSVVSVEGRCLLISVLSVNISPVSTKIPIIVKNVEYAGRLKESLFKQN